MRGASTPAFAWVGGFALLVLAQQHFLSLAQAPESLAGRTIELTVVSGDGPFASYGKYRFLPSATDDLYAIVPVYGDIAPSTGSYTYRRTSQANATLDFLDSLAGHAVATCTFRSTNSGDYTLTAGGPSSQRGTFVLYAGTSPASVAGFAVKVDITSGEPPFAEHGRFKFLPFSDNTYRVVPELGDVVESTGTYTYEKNSPFTGIVHFRDSRVGVGYTAQLSFDSATSGTIYLRQKNSHSYQTGLFVLELADTTGPLLAIANHKDSQTVTTSVVTLAGTATDAGRGDNGIESVTVNGQRANNDTAAGSVTANWYKTVVLSPGVNTITVVARDNSPNHNATTQTLTLTYLLPDAAGPVLSINSHTNQQTVTTNRITLLGTASGSGRGNNGIRSVTVNGERAANDTATGSGAANWSINLSLVPGANTVTVAAQDNSVNHNTTTVTLVIYYVALDVAGPSVTITSHIDGQTVSESEIVIAGTASDGGCGDNGVKSVTVNGDRANGDVATGSATARWSKIVGLVPGLNTITVVARDASPRQNTTTVKLSIYYVSAVSPTGATDYVYIEDALPQAGSTNVQGLWEWVSRDPVPISGNAAFKARNGSGLRGCSFINAKKVLPVNLGDSMLAYVYLNTAARPRMIMLQWRVGTSWEHRAYWGEDLFPTEWTKGEPASKVRIGDLPAAGQWVRLEVPARLVGLEAKEVNGLAVNVHDGEAAWDHIGKALAARDRVWVGDDVPDGAVTEAYWAETWTWTNASPEPYFGTRIHLSTNVSGMGTHFLSVPKPGWHLGANDSLFSYVFLDRALPPKMIMLQWWDGSWEHRAYWGEDRFPTSWTKGERTSKVFMGTLPASGQWVRLTVPAAIVGLDNKTVTGLAFTTYGGRAYWDNTGRSVPCSDFVWVNDQLPAGAVAQAYGGDAWTWSSSAPGPFSGEKMHVSRAANGLHGHYFLNAKDRLHVNRDDVLMAYVFVNPTNVPRMLMLQWNDGGQTNPWGHRAYWGETLFSYGVDGPPDRCYMGPLPAPGKWVRLEVPAKLLGLEGRTLQGMSFDCYGGEVAWDHAGKSSASLEEDVIWLADALPPGARTEEFNEPGWNWAQGFPTPVVGDLVHKSGLSLGNKSPREYHHHLFVANSQYPVYPGDKLFAYVYLDVVKPPQMVMVQWYDGLWLHRAYWGENKFPWGNDAPPERCWLGPLPALGQWVRLEVPASSVGLENRPVSGVAFSLYGGQAWWGHAGKTPPVLKPLVPATDWVWVDDEVPPGATTMKSGDDDWLWTDEEPGPVSGKLAHKSKWVPSGTVRSHYFAYYSGQPTKAMNVTAGDELFCYVYLDPYALPQMVMLQWRVGTSWEHRAYWGENLFAYGANGPTSKVHMGILPPAGKWVRLRVPAKAVGLEGQTVNGLAFTAAGGRIWWDCAGKRSGAHGAGLLSEVTSPNAASLRLPDNAGGVSWPRPVDFLDRCVFQGGWFYGVIRGLPIGSYRIEASTNLVDWVPIGIGEASELGTIHFFEPEAARYPCRFYRSKTLQDNDGRSLGGQ